MDVSELSHPRQLPARIVAGSPLHRLDVTRQQLIKAERLAGGRRRAGGVGTANLRLRAGGDHRLDPRVDPLVQLLALEHQPDEQRAVAHLAGPQLGVLGVTIELSGVEQLERPDDPLAVAGIDLRRGPRSSLAQEAVERRRASALELGDPVLAGPFGRWRAQAELGERRAQV